MLKSTRLHSTRAAGLLIGLLFASTSQAAFISYYLDQSNKLADGVNYLKVTISDEGKEGNIDFTVEALQPLLDLAGKDFGIRKFAFNILGGVGAEAADVTELPDFWTARNGGRMDGFGLYDLRVTGRGTKNRQDPLTFSITGVDLDTIQSYVDYATGKAPQGLSLFAAQVSGINGTCKTDSDSDGGKPKTNGASNGNGTGTRCVRTAYFGGDTSTAVPAPPAVWLLGTALAGLAARRFRKGAKTAHTA